MRYSHGKFFYSIEAKAAPVLKNRGQRLMKKTESIRESVGWQFKDFFKVEK